jgi:hypothetical protein
VMKIVNHFYNWLLELVRTYFCHILINISTNGGGTRLGTALNTAFIDVYGAIVSV